MILLCELKPDY